MIESAGQGDDAVFASVNYGLTANVETLVLQGSADLQGFGNGSANSLFGNTGNNLIDGGGGADAMSRRAGNDTYFVDNVADAVIEGAGQGNDAVFAFVNYGLTAIRGDPGAPGGRRHRPAPATCWTNAMFGNSGNNTLDGQGGADILTGNAGDDTFVFNVGQANGDTVVDFAGNGAGAGDCSTSSATARAPASPTSTRRTGRSTTMAALARRHHVQQRRGDRCDRLPVRVRTTPEARLLAVGPTATGEGEARKATSPSRFGKAAGPITDALPWHRLGPRSESSYGACPSRASQEQPHTVIGESRESPDKLKRLCSAAPSLSICRRLSIRLGAPPSPDRLDAVSPILFREPRYSPVTAALTRVPACSRRPATTSATPTRRGAACAVTSRIGRRSGAKRMAIDLVNVAAGAGGFVIHGQDANDVAGRSVSSAGDVNGDGFDDVIIGAPSADGPGNTRPGAGDSYVVFGKASGFAAEIDLAAVASGNGGFVIHGQDAGDLSGYSVSSAGDVNGDGFDDILIGALVADGPGNTRDKAGDSYVVFGHAGDFAAEIDLAAVAAGNGGFVIHGQDANDISGYSVSVGRRHQRRRLRRPDYRGRRRRRPGNSRDHAGASYVLFGHAGGFAAEIDLAAVAAGNGGFVIHGQDAGDSSGWSVSSAGDVNGDGFDDLIIGAVMATAPATHGSVRVTTTWCSARPRALQRRSTSRQSPPATADS